MEILKLEDVIKIFKPIDQYYSYCLDNEHYTTPNILIDTSEKVIGQMIKLLESNPLIKLALEYQQVTNYPHRGTGMTSKMIDEMISDARDFAPFQHIVLCRHSYMIHHIYDILHEKLKQNNNLEIPCSYHKQAASIIINSSEFRFLSEYDNFIHLRGTRCKVFIDNSVTFEGYIKYKEFIGEL